MWWTAALQAYQAKQGGGGSGGGGAMDQLSSRSELSAPFDSSNWTVATGGSSAWGQRPSSGGAENTTTLYIIAGVAVTALLIAAIAARGK